MATTESNVLQRLLDFLNRLDAARLRYSLAHFRDDTVAVEVVVPGERWEVEFFVDGTVDVEVFTSIGPAGIELQGAQALERLFVVHAEGVHASRPVT